VSKLPERDIVNVGAVQLLFCDTVSFRGLCLNYLKRLSQSVGIVFCDTYSKLPGVGV
jgi:hypothetical protein